jgi:hypothetical protein
MGWCGASFSGPFRVKSFSTCDNSGATFLGGAAPALLLDVRSSRSSNYLGVLAFVVASHESSLPGLACIDHKSLAVAMQLR